MAKLRKKMSGNFTLISNEIFSDPRLSYRDVGIYCNMLSFPDNWDFTIVKLSKIHSEKKDAVSSSVSRLIDLGYVSRSKTQIRNEGGRFAMYEYTIYECPADNPSFVPWEEKNSKKKSTEKNKKERKKLKKPRNRAISPKTDLPASVKPTSDKPTSGNPQSNNTISIKTLSTNTEEDDDISHACAKVDLEAVKSKVTNFYMSHALSMRYPQAKEDIDRAADTMLSVLTDIKDPDIVAKINDATREEMEELLSQIYSSVFCRVFDGRPVKRVCNKKEYVRTVVGNWFSYGSGKDMWKQMTGANK